MYYVYWPEYLWNALGNENITYRAKVFYGTFLCLKTHLNNSTRHISMSFHFIKALPCCWLCKMTFLATPKYLRMPAQSSPSCMVKKQWSFTFGDFKSFSNRRGFVPRLKFLRKCIFHVAFCNWSMPLTCSTRRRNGVIAGTYLTFLRQNDRFYGTLPTIQFIPSFDGAGVTLRYAM